ncbi:collagen alpha-3(VI) chain-like [Pristis pectinata]|uniref:collagen alpha-3(VI) chain-like n=1 Tax=Pristis pectinata TaxID=685728 RepID=UPI00223E609A|nr:collagen alpha-3(VI) chain-like [Pristis pectinata]
MKMQRSVSLLAVLRLVLLYFVTETRQAQESADLIFLIDGSNNVRPAEFQFIQSFIANFIEDLNIGPNAIQIAVVQYSHTPSTEFYLNTYHTRTEVLKAMKNIRQKGGGEANIGLALQFLMDKHFTPSAGSRAAEDVPQVMILVTSRRSSDDVRSGVFSVKKQGTFTFVIGVKGADAAEAKMIATDPSFTMLVPDFQRMASTREQLMPLFSLVAKKQLVIEVQESKVEAQVSKRDIIFLIDGSSTVGNANFLEISKFILNIVNKFVIGPDSVQVGVVQYSDDALTEFYLNTHSTQSALQTAVKGLRMKGGWEVNTGAALDYVFKNHFTRAAGSRKDDGVPQLLVVITGEKSMDVVKLPAETLKRSAVMTLAIGVKNADPAQMKEIAIDPSLVFNVENFQSLPEIKEQVMTPLSTLAGVTIIYEQPTEPSKKEVDKRDIVFLIDGSYSSGRRNLPAIQNFITKTVEAFDIGTDAVQVGLVQYSDIPKSEFFLNTYSSKDEILSHVRQLRLRGGTVLKTGEALNYVLRYLFTKYSGSRQEEGVPQFLILITGGRSRDDVKQPSEALSRAGIKTLAVGFENAIKQQLQDISSDPSLVFNVKELRSLPEIQQEVLLPLSTLNSATQTLSCRYLRLPSLNSVNHLDRKVVTQAAKKDIVFLIDGSFHVGNRNLPAIRDFITSIIETLDIGSDRVRVGLVQYSDTAEHEFYLNTYSSKDELITEVNKLRLRGGTEVKTGAALDYVHKYIFTKYAGSRKEEGVPQFLILITGGRSRDDIKTPSDALLRSGVMTLAIGAKNAVRQQLQEAALDPSMVYNVKEFDSLPEIQQDILLPLSTLSGVKLISEWPTIKSINENADTQERDIVFLIDGSVRTAASFPFVREFLRGVIKQLNIGENRNRIAVVQYSDKARVEFPLNAFSNKDDVLAAVEKLRPVGGIGLNTGAALEHVIRNVFTTAAGSRRVANVPQILVLLISGKSKDNIRERADALKRAAIVTFVIGAADADGRELKEIAYSSNLLFAVQDFKSLPEFQDQLLQPLKTLIVEVIKMPTGVTEGHKRDIVFLIDGSSHVGTFFYLIRDLIINLIPNFDIAKDKDQVSVVQYSDDTRVEFPLNALTTKEELLAAVKRLRLKGGRKLKTGAALDFVRRNVFSKSGGGRKHLGISQILLLITSGKSQDDVRKPSEDLKRAGVMPFTIGIGEVERSELRQIAYSPKLSFQVDNYWGLSDLDLHLLSISQNTENVPIPSTISSGVDRRDIVFLIDGSSKIGKGFPAVRKFMAKTVESFDVGEGKVQFGVVQFSEDPRTEFFLNTHSTKKKVLVAIKRLKLKRGQKINIGQALDHVIRNIFTSSAGSRIDNAIPQILVLVTSGKSNDDISQQAAKLRELGIVLFGIGLKKADQTVLEPLVYSPSLAFPVKTFQGLLNIQNQLQQIIKTVAVEVVERPAGDK